MKRLIVTCKYCGKSEKITGRDVDEIVKLLDIFGWGGCDDICPKCMKKEA